MGRRAAGAIGSWALHHRVIQDIDLQRRRRGGRSSSGRIIACRCPLGIFSISTVCVILLRRGLWVVLIGVSLRIAGFVTRDIGGLLGGISANGAWFLLAGVIGLLSGLLRTVILGEGI